MKYSAYGNNFATAESLHKWLCGLPKSVREEVEKALPEHLGPGAYKIYRKELAEAGIGNPKPSRPFVCLTYYLRTKKPNYEQASPVLYVEYVNFQELLATFFLEVYYDHKQIQNWRAYCIGITSQTGLNGEHMPMMDYDGKGIRKLIRKDVKKFQELYGLGPAQIFSTKKGAHVYFPTDMVPSSTYLSMIKESSCCEGFKKATLSQGYGVLRVSAKYTTFDIKPAGLILPADGAPRRPHILGVTAANLLDLGLECGTHFASMFPQWAKFHEDEKTWKPGEKTPEMLMPVKGKLKKGMIVDGPADMVIPYKMGQYLPPVKSEFVVKPYQYGDKPDAAKQPQPPQHAYPEPANMKVAPLQKGYFSYNEGPAKWATAVTTSTWGDTSIVSGDTSNYYVYTQKEKQIKAKAEIASAEPQAMPTPIPGENKVSFDIENAPVADKWVVQLDSYDDYTADDYPEPPSGYDE